MRPTLIAECATNHGGDMALAGDMIAAAADAGADIVKFQSYSIGNLRRDDPQYEWFAQCELSEDDHAFLIRECGRREVRCLFTAFHENDLNRLWRMAQQEVKIGSGEGRGRLVGLAVDAFSHVYATTAWGDVNQTVLQNDKITWLATVPLYPAPVECFSRCDLRDGYSCHHVGLDVAKIAMYEGAKVIEKHFALPGRGRQQPWNMGPADIAELRRWAEVCAQANRGSRFEGRWAANG